MKVVKVLQNIKLGAFGSYIENKNKLFYEEAVEAIKELEELINEDKYILNEINEALSMGAKAQSLALLRVFRVLSNRNNRIGDNR